MSFATYGKVLSLTLSLLISAGPTLAQKSDDWASGSNASAPTGDGEGGSGCGAIMAPPVPGLDKHYISANLANLVKFINLELARQVQTGKAQAKGVTVDVLKDANVNDTLVNFVEGVGVIVNKSTATALDKALRTLITSKTKQRALITNQDMRAIATRVGLGAKIKADVLPTTSTTPDLDKQLTEAIAGKPSIMFASAAITDDGAGAAAERGGPSTDLDGGGEPGHPEHESIEARCDRLYPRSSFSGALPNQDGQCAPGRTMHCGLCYLDPGHGSYQDDFAHPCKPGERFGRDNLRVTLSSVNTNGECGCRVIESNLVREKTRFKHKLYPAPGACPGEPPVNLCATTAGEIEYKSYESWGWCTQSDGEYRRVRVSRLSVSPSLGAINLSPSADENGNVVLAPNYTVDQSYHVQEMIHPQTGAVTQATLPGRLSTYQVIGTECETQATELPAPVPAPSRYWTIPPSDIVRFGN